MGYIVGIRERELRRAGVLPKEMPLQPLWPFDQTRALDVFRSAADRLGLPWLAETLYALRHGGASRDVNLGLRPMQEILKRGRWAGINSIRHYDRHARLQWILRQIGTATVARGRNARQRFMSAVPALCCLTR